MGESPAAGQEELVTEIVRYKFPYTEAMRPDSCSQISNIILNHANRIDPEALDS